MEIEVVSVDSLIPYARNSRTHSDEQIAQVAASIREFGYTNPVLIDGESNIIAGHGRVLAARKLGLDEVPCIRLTHLTDAQRRAYVIADNKLALNSGWDDELLEVELADLSSAGFDTLLTGFTQDEIDALLTTNDDSAPTGPTEDCYASVFEVSVTCEDESDQEVVFNMMTARGYKCRVLSM